MFATLLLVSGSGWAAPPEKPLRQAIKVGPSECLKGARIAEQLAKQLDRSSLDARLFITITDEAQKTTFTLHWDERMLGRRTLMFDDPPCDDRVNAVVVALALAMDALVFQKPASPTPSLTVPDKPLPDTPGIRLNPGLAVEGGVLVSAPSPAAWLLAPAVDLTLADTWGVRLSALVTSSALVQVPPGAANVSLLAGRLDTCVSGFVGADFRLRGCGGFAAGGINAQGVGFSRIAAARVPWVALGARFDTRLALAGPFGVEASLDGFAAVIRPQLTVEGSGTSWTSPILGFMVGLAPSVIF